jgi:hypothetical protein
LRKLLWLARAEDVPRCKIREPSRAIVYKAYSHCASPKETRRSYFVLNVRCAKCLCCPRRIGPTGKIARTRGMFATAKAGVISDWTVSIWNSGEGSGCKPTSSPGGAPRHHCQSSVTPVTVADIPPHPYWISAIATRAFSQGSPLKAKISIYDRVRFFRRTITH